jgi:hypothetical protein
MAAPDSQLIRIRTRNVIQAMGSAVELLMSTSPILSINNIPDIDYRQALSARMLACSSRSASGSAALPAPAASRPLFQRTHGEARIHSGLEAFIILGSKYTSSQTLLCHFGALLNLNLQKVIRA